jgi:hypothetical protein
MQDPILVINAGSSSIKFSVFETAGDRSLAAGLHGQVEGIGTSSRFEVADATGRQLAERKSPVTIMGLRSPRSMTGSSPISAALRVFPASAIASFMAAASFRNR